MTGHVAHVELDGGTGGYYLWCEDDDCDAEFRRYTVEMEALDAAANHEAHHA